MAIFDPLNPSDGRKATDGHTEPAITLLDGRTLVCYPKAETATQPPQDNGGKNFFTDHALFFFDHREQILSDSRMFLAPVPIASGLAYVGNCGFQHPTLGVYIEWWMRHAPFILGKQGKESWLVYHLAGSPLSGRNSCGIVNQKGKLKGECIPGPFKELWMPFTQINTYYDDAKERFEAYSLEEVAELLKADGEIISQPDRSLFFLQQKKLLYLYKIWGLWFPTEKEKEKFHRKLLKRKRKQNN